jgi:hypothetical protein
MLPAPASLLELEQLQECWPHQATYTIQNTVPSGQCTYGAHEDAVSHSKLGIQEDTHDVSTSDADTVS